MLFCTELEKSKPSSVNFACFFFFHFSIMFFTVSFSIFISIGLILFFKKIFLISAVGSEVYCIHFCLSFFANPWKKKTWISLSVVSLFLPLTFTICKSSSFFLHFSQWKMIWHFFLLSNLPKCYLYRTKNTLLGKDDIKIGFFICISSSVKKELLTFLWSNSFSLIVNSSLPGLTISFIFSWYQRFVYF